MKTIISRLMLAVMAMTLTAMPAEAQSSTPEVVGTLTLYYAKANINLQIEGFGEPFKAGQFLFDSNDINVSIASLNKSYYKISTEFESGKILKSSITTKQYSMNRLPADLIGQAAVFVDKHGHKARIFRSSNNGHKYQQLSAKFKQEKEKNPNLYDDETMLPPDRPKPGQSSYALSVEYVDANGENLLFEEPLNVTNGFFDLYFDSATGLECSSVDKGRLIGVVENVWTTPESWPEGKSAYDAQGRLLTNLEQTWPEPCYETHSIAYIANEDALYFNGTLYYRQK